MSARKFVNLFYHWGGVVLEDNQLGLSYDGGSQGFLRIKIGTKYKSLVRKLHEVTGIDSSVENLVLSCRLPVFIGSTESSCTYVRLVVDSDDAVDGMLCSIAENPQLGAMYLYIDTVPALNEPNVRNHDLVRNRSTVQPNYSQQPFSLNNPNQFQSGSSSQYQNPPLVMPTQQSFEQAQPNIIPQSPFAAVAEMLQQTQTMDPSVGEDDDTDCSDDEEMARVESEMEALGGTGGDNVEVELAGAERLYTPMEYYTTPQEDLFGEGYDWQTPRDYRDRSFFDPKKDQLKEGLLFRSKDEVQVAVRMYNITAKREYKVKKSNKKLWEVECMNNGSSWCPWRLRASIQMKHNLWEIVRYAGEHTCIFDQLSRDHAQITSKMIAGLVASLVKNDPAYKISNIIVQVVEQFSFTVSYYKAWSAKQKAVAMIFGDWESSYQVLPRFLGAIIKYNPGSIMRYKTLDRNQILGTIAPGVDVLDRIFFAFKPCMEGWRSCRPMICIDATHLYGRYKGKILMAVGKDANSQIYPLAFAYVDEESKSTWGWFLKHLRIEVVGPRMHVCVISDRHKGILAAIKDPDNGWGRQYRAHHRYCIRHVRSNLLAKFKDEELKNIFWKAATEFQPRKFDAAMEEMRLHNADAHAYCMSIPPRMWSLCHDGGFRYGETTSNCAEVFNFVLRAARSLPISAAVQSIYYKLVQWFYEKRTKSNANIPDGGLPITRKMLEIFDRYQGRSGRHTVIMFCRETFKAEVRSNLGVRIAVSLNERTCSCGKWEINHVPCSHVIAVCNHVGLNSTQYFSQYFTIAAWRQNYAPQFEPLRHEDYWDEPIDMNWIPNPNLKRTKGRPQENRFFNEMDNRYEVAQKHCGICRAPGHTRARCPQRPTPAITRHMP